MADFRERYSPWYEGGQVEDRRNEPWPWHQLSNDKQSLTAREGMEAYSALNPELPPTTPLGVAAGVNDVKPPDSAELLKFLIDIEMANAGPPARRR